MSRNGHFTFTKEKFEIFACEHFACDFRIKRQMDKSFEDIHFKYMHLILMYED